MQRIFDKTEAYDLRGSAGGIHGVEFRLLIKSPKGATQFLIYTNRHLEHVQKERVDRVKSSFLKKYRDIDSIPFKDNAYEELCNYCGPFPEGQELEEFFQWASYLETIDLGDFDYLFKPMGADVGYHSPVPRYASQKPAETDCKYLGQPCYYDGSALSGRKLYEFMIEEGIEAMWEKLEEYHREDFYGDVNL